MSCDWKKISGIVSVCSGAISGIYTAAQTFVLAKKQIMEAKKKTETT